MEDKKVDSRIHRLTAEYCQAILSKSRHKEENFPYMAFSYRVADKKLGEPDTRYKVVLRGCSEELPKNGYFVYMLRAESTTRVAGNDGITFFTDAKTFPDQTAVVPSSDGTIKFWFGLRRWEYVRTPAKWSLELEIMECDTVVPPRILQFTPIFGCNRPKWGFYSVPLPSGFSGRPLSLALLDYWNELFGIPKDMRCRVEGAQGVGVYSSHDHDQRATFVTEKDLVFHFRSFDGGEHIPNILEEFMMVFEIRRVE